MKTPLTEETSSNKMENLLVLILLNSLQNETTAEKAFRLNLAGFSNLEIGRFLETTPAVIGQVLYARRKKGKK